MQLKICTKDERLRGWIPTREGEGRTQRAGQARGYCERAAGVQGSVGNFTFRRSLFPGGELSTSGSRLAGGRMARDPCPTDVVRTFRRRGKPLVCSMPE